MKTFALCMALSVAGNLFYVSQYSYTRKATPEQWQAQLDTLSAIEFNIGRSMTLDQAEPLKQYIFHLRVDIVHQVGAQIKADSTKTKRP